MSWHVIQHWLAVHTGSVDEPGVAPGNAFWGGIGSNLSVMGAGFAVWKRLTCHTWWCPRHGHYDLTDAATGITYKLCRHCHPSHAGQRLTRQLISRIHAQSRDQAEG